MLHRSLTDLPIHAAMAGSLAVDTGARVAEEPVWVWDDAVELSHVPTTCFEVLRAAGWQRVKRRRWVFPLEVNSGAVHVAPDGDDEFGDGSCFRPFKSIGRSLANNGPQNSGITVVKIAPGVYDAGALVISNQFVQMIGPRSGRPAVLRNGFIRVCNGGCLSLW